MLFNSLSFFIFFPIVVLFYFLIPQKCKNIWLLIASYYFYMSWNIKYGLLLLFCTFITYIASVLLEKNKAKRLFVVALIALFSTLFYYKYFTFLVSTIQKLMGKLGIAMVTPQFDIVLPVGISFFTFQAAGYLIDVYRGEIKAEHNFLKYALFVSFFPQLVAGPIERSKNLLGQLDRTYSFDFERIRDGLFLMLWGFFLKLVIADRAAIFVNEIYAVDSNAGGGLILVATILFAFQIYGDFGGYSYIAVGAAKIIGISLMDNFQSPYLALSTKDFWNRWHISLNSWFRDYLYIPLGGNRKGKLRKNINILIVFLISGLWHGASWNFVFWGGLNGIYQIVSSYCTKWLKKIGKKLQLKEESFSHKLIQVITTFLLVDFAWLFFRANGLMDGFQKVCCIFMDFRLRDFSKISFYSHGLNEANFRVLSESIILLLLVDFAKTKGVSIREYIYKQEMWFRILVFTGSVLIISILGVWGNLYDAQNFIYFQF